MNPQPRTYTIVHNSTGVRKSFCVKLQADFSWGVEVYTFDSRQPIDIIELPKQIFTLAAGRHEWSRIIGNESGWRYA